MRKTIPFLILAALLALAGPASAEKCSIEEAPAATLLLPYFETDLVAPGLETIVSIRNADKNPVLANFIVWSDVGVPLFSFPIGLKPYASYDLSMRELLTEGRIPASYRGTFTDCGSQLPVPDIAPTLLQAIQEGVTGRPVVMLSGQCVGLSLPGRPNVAHGYVTIDVVKRCKAFYTPFDDFFEEYFNGKGAAKPRIVSDDNKLLGQSIFVDPSAGLTYPMAHAETLVHIEAYPTAFKKNDYTFYGRLVKWQGWDKREPLATNFAVGFGQGGVYGGTELFVWRDRRERVEDLKPFACASPPASLRQTAAVVFDEEGGHKNLSGVFFGAAAQRVDLVDSGLRPAPPVEGDFGWFFFNLGHRGGTPPTRDQRSVAQGWIVGLINSAATSTPIYTAGYHAMQLDSACRGKAENVTMPKP